VLTEVASDLGMW